MCFLRWDFLLFDLYDLIVSIFFNNVSYPALLFLDFRCHFKLIYFDLVRLLCLLSNFSLSLNCN